MNDAPSPATLSNPDTWLDQHGDSLYRFALMRVRNPSTAEDMVQETLLAAWRARSNFAGGSAERTWLIAILKNKIIDYFRRYRHEAPLLDNADTDDAIDALFAKHTDHWARLASVWATRTTRWNGLNSGGYFKPDCLGDTLWRAGRDRAPHTADLNQKNGPPVARRPVSFYCFSN